MSNIAIISKTTDYQAADPDHPSGNRYLTVRGEVTRKDETYAAATVLDGMISAQDDLGQVNWVNLSATIAQGWVYNSQYGGNDRVAVIDTDNADGSDIIDAINALHAI